MRMKEIEWSEITATASPTWEKSADWKRVVKKTRDLYVLPSIGIAGFADFAISCDEWGNLKLWQKIGERFLPLPFTLFGEETTTESLVAFLENYPFRGKDGWKKFLEGRREAGTIVDYLWTMPLPEEAAACLESNKRIMEKQEAERKAEEEKRAADEARAQAEAKAELDKAVEEAITKIKNGGIIVNKDGTLIIYLASRAGIKVPLRSDGWIREWLYRLDIKDGKVESVYLNRAVKKTKVSDSMWNLLNKIVAAYYKDGGETK